MTLLIGTLSKSNVVLTADGRCRKDDGGYVTIVDKLQKIFPLPGFPLAVAHHGQNIIAGRDVGKIVEYLAISAGEAILAEGPKPVAEALADYINRDVQATLRELRSAALIGFWIAGFGQQDLSSSLYEVAWTSQVQGPKIQKFPEGQLWDVVLGGDGKHYIEGNMTKCRLSEDTGIGSLKRCCDDLYSQAMQRQQNTGGDEFGGHKHQLSIMKNGCHWYIPPLSDVAP